MSEYGDLCKYLREQRKSLRRELGIDCPQCKVKQPKRTPTILLPGQRCKVCGYKDPRQRAKIGAGETASMGKMK